MLPVIIPVGGAIVLIAIVLLSVYVKNRRARIGVMMLAVSGVALAEYGYVAFVREERSSYEALLKERKRLCGEVAADIVHHQNWFLRGPSQAPLGERAAALRALEREVSATWRICVRKDSECKSLLPSVVVNGEWDTMQLVRRCYEAGPAPMENARSFLGD